MESRHGRLITIMYATKASPRSSHNMMIHTLEKKLYIIVGALIKVCLAMHTSNSIGKGKERNSHSTMLSTQLEFIGRKTLTLRQSRLQLFPKPPSYYGEFDGPCLQTVDRIIEWSNVHDMYSLQYKWQVNRASLLLLHLHIVAPKGDLRSSKWPHRCISHLQIWISCNSNKHPKQIGGILRHPLVTNSYYIMVDLAIA